MHQQIGFAIISPPLGFLPMVFLLASFKVIHKVVFNFHSEWNELALRFVNCFCCYWSRRWSMFLTGAYLTLLTALWMLSSICFPSPWAPHNTPMNTSVDGDIFPSPWKVTWDIRVYISYMDVKCTGVDSPQWVLPTQELKELPTVIIKGWWRPWVKSHW